MGEIFRGKILLPVTFSDRKRTIQMSASCAFYFMVNRIEDGLIWCPEIRLCVCDEDRLACFKIRPCINVFRWRCVEKKDAFHLLLTPVVDGGKDKMSPRRNPPPQTDGNSVVQKSGFKNFSQSV